MPFSVFSQMIDHAMERALPTNIVYKDDGFYISVKVPGIARKDISVDIQGRTLRVSINKAIVSVECPVEKNVEHVTTEKSPALSPICVVHLAEFDIPSKAERTFQFREALDADAASIDLTAGVLTISVTYQLRGSKRTLMLDQE